MILSHTFQFLNNITHISTHFFIHTYFQKIQITLPNGPKFLSCLVRREKYDDFFCDTQAFSSLTLCLVGWILGGMENIGWKMG